MHLIDKLTGLGVPQTGRNGAAHTTPLNTYQAPTPAPVLTAALSNVATIETEGLSRLNVELAIAGAPLTAFHILARYHASGTYQTLYSASGEYLSPAGLLLGASGDLTVQPAGSSGYFQLDVTGMESVQLLASGAGATVTILAGAQ